MITGKATPTGTAAYAHQHPTLAYQPLSDTGLLVSQAGFGCYRVDVSVPTHQAALQKALLAGINLIDTSTNYSDGGSEELVGAVLAQKPPLREAVVIVSKVGYLQGQNYDLSQQLKHDGRPFPDLVEYAPGLEQCIHPVFLADQLTRSLGRLQLATLDVYLLHNPEYYLGWAHHHGLPLAQARQEYYRRIELAFRHLEQEVSNGRLQYYGVSSNTFPTPADDPEHTSLEQLYTIAQTISPNHHFRVIQFPMNLLETGGATEPNQSGGRSVLAFAQEKGLAVLINRPLNAIRANNLTRLADPPPAEPVPVQTVSTSVDTLVTMENDFRRRLLPRLTLPDREQNQLAQLLAAGHMLHGRWQDFASQQNWLNVAGQALIPRIENALHFLSNRPNLPVEVSQWLDRYANEVNNALTAIDAFYATAEHERTEAIKQQVRAIQVGWGDAATLSQIALRALRSTTGVTTVLVGMRREDYVTDILTELQHPLPQPPTPNQSAWQALQHAL